MNFLTQLRSWLQTLEIRLAILIPAREAHKEQGCRQNRRVLTPRRQLRRQTTSRVRRVPMAQAKFFRGAEVQKQRPDTNFTEETDVGQKTGGQARHEALPTILAAESTPFQDSSFEAGERPLVRRASATGHRSQ